MGAKRHVADSSSANVKMMHHREARFQTPIRQGSVIPLLMFVCLFVVFSHCFPNIAIADETLTLELPPSAAAKSMESAKRYNKQSESYTRIPPNLRRPTFTPASRGRAIPPPPKNQNNYTSREVRSQTSSNQNVVGRLGQVMSATPIYRSQSSNAPKLSTVPRGTYLAIPTESGNWYGVLMADSTIGWIRRGTIRILQYDVVSTGARPAQPAQIPQNFSDGMPSTGYPVFRGDAQSLFRVAHKYLGVPYYWGGNTIRGIDCSGFIKNIFAANGISLPRVSADQVRHGLAIPKSDLLPGDRLYFGNRAKKKVTHTGLYLGNGYFIHSSSNEKGVAISHLNEPTYVRMYICSRR